MTADSGSGSGSTPERNLGSGAGKGPTTDSTAHSSTRLEALFESTASTDPGHRVRTARETLRRTRVATRTGLRSVGSTVRRALAAPTASDVATIAVTLAVALVVGSSLVGAEIAVLAAVAGVAAAIVTTCLASPRPIVRGFGGVLAVPVAVVVAVPSTLALAFGLGLAGAGVFAATTLWALVYAGFAAALVSWDRIGDGGVRRGSTGTMLAAVGVVGVVVLRILPEAGVRERAGEAATDSLSSLTGIVVADGSWAPVTFFLFVVCGSVLLGRTLGSLPFERVLPPDRRGGFATHVDRVRTALSLVTRVGVVCLLATLLAPPIVDDAADVPATPTWIAGEVPAPAGDAVATLVTASSLRILLVALALGCGCVLVGEWLRRAMRRGLATVLARLLAPVLGGALVSVVLARALADPAVDSTLQTTLEEFLPAALAELIASFPAFALAAVVLVLAMASLSSTLLTVTWLRVFRILPPRAIGAALAALSVFVLAVALAIVGRVEGAIWTGAAAFVVWDLGEYADSLRTELGSEPATLRAELVHAGSSLLTGAIVGGGTVALYRWVLTDVPIVDPRLATVAVGAGIVTVVLVAWVLRG